MLRRQPEETHLVMSCTLGAQQHEHVRRSAVVETKFISFKRSFSILVRQGHDVFFFLILMHSFNQKQGL